MGSSSSKHLHIYIYLIHTCVKETEAGTQMVKKSLKASALSGYVLMGDEGVGCLEELMPLCR